MMKIRTQHCCLDIVRTRTLAASTLPGDPLTFLKIDWEFRGNKCKSLPELRGGRKVFVSAPKKMVGIIVQNCAPCLRR